MLEIFDQLLGQGDQYPNTFSVLMGKRIKEARIEGKMSQAEIAKNAYFRQAAISDIEKGKRAVTAAELVRLSYILGKDIIYFFPDNMVEKIDSNSLSLLEKELVLLSKKLELDDLKKLIVQVRALADY